MGIKGKLETVSLPDLFQLLSIGRKTGTLTVSNDYSQKQIAFKDGKVVHSSSSKEDEHLGNLLLRKGIISEADLGKALRVGREKGERLGKVLVELGLAPEGEVAVWLRRQTEESIYDLFGWEKGEFSFEEGRLPPQQDLIPPFEVMSLIMEGTKRMDELSELQKKLPPPHTILKVKDFFQTEKEEITLTPLQIQVLPLIDGRRPMGKVIEESEIGGYLATKALYELLSVDLLEKVKKEKPKKRDKAPDEPLILHSAIDLYQRVFLIIQNQMVKKLGPQAKRLAQKAFARSKRRYPTLFRGVRLREDSLLDFSLLEAKSLSLPPPIRFHLLLGGMSDLIRESLTLIQDVLGKNIRRETIRGIEAEVGPLFEEKSASFGYIVMEEEIKRSLE